MIVVVGCMSRVATDLEYSELSTSTKFSCSECTNNAKVFYPLHIFILHTVIFQPLTQIYSYFWSV